jgi:hypothetical protein
MRPEKLTARRPLEAFFKIKLKILQGQNGGQ